MLCEVWRNIDVIHYKKVTIVYSCRRIKEMIVLVISVIISSIGKLHKIEVWHDHSGDEVEWYLERIVVKNVVDGEKFFFFCNK